MQKIVPMNRRMIRARHTRLFFGVKRLFDLALASFLLVLLFPLLSVIAVAVAIDTGSTPIFVQIRMGRNNVPFKMMKFRTMSPNAPANVATYKLKDADRYISRLGRFLRRSSLDELPQLWNILLGHMSFIGPRPVVLTERALLELRTRNGANTVRPGLTGWAQVNGRDDVPITEKAMLDAYYVQRFSLAVDLRILVRTVGYVFRGEGVTEGANPRVDDSLRHSA